MDIKTSLHGRAVGLGQELVSGQQPPLLAPGGFMTGPHGKQAYLPGPDVVVFNDDFIGDALDAKWNIVEGTESATSDAAILAGGIGGVLRFTTGAAGTGLAADMIQMTQALQWQASNGGLYIEARLKLSAITTCYAFFGFTDLVTLEAPVVSAASGDTLTTNATDAVGFMFDTRMTTDNWWLVGVANNTDATAQNTGVAPVADTYETFRIEVSAAGVALFYRNGVVVGTAMTDAVTAATDLTPTFNVSKTSVAASMTADIDYIAIGMLR
jgi:hypothetical protein